jgi:hypothetical protein
MPIKRQLNLCEDMKHEMLLRTEVWWLLREKITRPCFWAEFRNVPYFVEYPLHPSHCLTSTSLHTWLAYADRLMNYTACLLQWWNIYMFITTDRIASLHRMCSCIEQHLDVIIARADNRDSELFIRHNFCFLLPLFHSNWAVQLYSALAVQSYLIHLRFCLLFLSVVLLPVLAFLYVTVTMWRHLFISWGMQRMWIVPHPF